VFSAIIFYSALLGYGGIVYNLNGIDSKFRLAILVARRAKQLIGGAKKKVDIKAENVLTIALEEFKQGKIDFDILNQDTTLLDEENQELGVEAAVENIGKIEEDSEATEEEIQPQPES
jgi:DNA-directed RNA polymerase subunit omega